jgi:hypothetical protein
MGVLDANDREFVETYTRHAKAGLTRIQIASAMGYGSANALGNKRRRLESRTGVRIEDLDERSDANAGASSNRSVKVLHPLDPELTVDELVNIRKRQFAKKAEAEDSRRCVDVKVPDAGPYALWFFGDPHVDDDGTDIAELERHGSIIRNEPALYGANVGDTTNNWVGRLARLYGDQSTTASQAWMLAEWFIGLVGPKWMFMIGGNHDAWSGAGDPIKWIAKEHNALYESSECRLRLTSPCGRSLIVNARHDFSGDSQWNPAHSVMKAAQLGVRDDVLICGHKHKSGYMPLKDPENKKIMHCIQVASYKTFDRYAREKGFRDQAISPGCMIVVDPAASRETGFIQVFHDFDLGVEFLRFLRSK